MSKLNVPSYLVYSILLELVNLFFSSRTCLAWYDFHTSLVELVICVSKVMLLVYPLNYCIYIYIMKSPCIISYS